MMNQKNSTWLTSATSQEIIDSAKKQMNSHQYHSAIELLKDAIKISRDKTSRGIYYNLIGDCQMYLYNGFSDLALKAYEKGAQLGNANSHYALAHHYYRPLAVASFATKLYDRKKMAHHYKAAADLGHREAAKEMAICYRCGAGVPKDLKLEQYYQNLYEQKAAPKQAPAKPQPVPKPATAKPQTASQPKPAPAKPQPDPKPQSVPDSASSAEPLSREALLTLARLTEPHTAESFYSLSALARYSGESDLELEFMKKAADMGHPTCLTAIACAYFEGQGVPQDERKAGELFLKAAELNEPTACGIVGTNYLYGSYGFPQDLYRSVAYFTRACLNRPLDNLSLHHLGAIPVLAQSKLSGLDYDLDMCIKIVENSIQTKDLDILSWIANFYGQPDNDFYNKDASDIFRKLTEQ